jgi:hypothetical protein
MFDLLEAASLVARVTTPARTLRPEHGKIQGLPSTLADSPSAAEVWPSVDQSIRGSR